uniref:IlGF domain-containing protein n=1 Tax=Ascaris lumbricoides TaxID=6252 RepID=A0A0M3IAZ9_ASCLU
MCNRGGGQGLINMEKSTVSFNVLVSVKREKLTLGGAMCPRKGFACGTCYSIADFQRCYREEKQTVVNFPLSAHKETKDYGQIVN